MRDYEPYYTEDGSIGLYSYADNDVYHSKYGALTEAWEKFILPSNIPYLLTFKKEIKVLDVCYGIGYNTKALMSYVINKNTKIKKRKALFNIFYFVSICINKIKHIIQTLLLNNGSIHKNNLFDDLPHINIDCMDINEDLIKLSPLFKTIKTPEEIFLKIIPGFLSCFKFYNLLKKIFIFFSKLFYPKNKKEIKELLDIKYKNMHIDKEYKINGLVNYILLNHMYRMYGKQYFNKNLKNFLRNYKFSKFLDKSLIKYAKFNHFYGYNLSSSNILSTFLHNIYYDCISKRYNSMDFHAAEKMFNLNFYINDARKSIIMTKNIYDCIFLDAFTYTKAPQLWSVEFVAELCRHLSDKGVILTYSNSAQIRNTFLENKLYVGKIYNKKEDKFIGTIASKDKTKILYPLNSYELGLCNTKAGIPYHDPNLSFTKQEIIELREYEFKHSLLMSSSKYMKICSLRASNQEDNDNVKE